VEIVPVPLHQQLLVTIYHLLVVARKQVVVPRVMEFAMDALQAMAHQGLLYLVVMVMEVEVQDFMAAEVVELLIAEMVAEEEVVVI
jgi:hypothetical protein